MPEAQRPFSRITIVLVVFWLAAISRLFIADTWDETNGLLVFGRAAGSALSIVRTVLTTPLPFWRPLPTLFVAMVIHLLPPRVAWPFLRVVNIALLLATLAVLLHVLAKWSGAASCRQSGSESEKPAPVASRWPALFALPYLFSSGALICATWYANVFDASAMLLLAAGIALLSRDRFAAAGLLFGAAFFFKETAAMAFPFLLLLVAMRRIEPRDAARAAFPAFLLGALYFALRSRVVSFGSAADTHQFRAASIVPSVAHFLGSFWVESLWSSAVFIPGLAALAISIAALRGARVRLAFGLYLLVAAGIYLELFDNLQDRQLIHFHMFSGRLYFIPVTLMLFLFGLERRWWLLLALALPLAGGALLTYMHYERFQRSYRNIYRYAEGAKRKPVRIYFPMKPLHDVPRSLEIGDFPDAVLKIDPVNGKLVER